MEGPAGHGAAYAQSEGEEKDAFEAAKALGTREAWDAFLAHYDRGFRTDLARAYLKKIDEQGSGGTPADAPATRQAYGDFPIEAGTWGGIVRSGPGQNYDRRASLAEGETISLMGVSPELENGFPWFKIWYDGGEKKGYMWGGIICAKGAERPGVFKVCTPSRDRTPRAEERDENRDEDRPPPRKRARSAEPGFDCGKPGDDAEAAICDDDELSRMDAQLNSEYALAVSNITSEAVGGTKADVAAFRREQSQWLSQRNGCGGDTRCLRRAYGARLKALKAQNEPE